MKSVHEQILDKQKQSITLYLCENIYTTDSAEEVFSDPIWDNLFMPIRNVVSPVRNMIVDTLDNEPDV